ncbi:MAG: hypothetical protein IPJ82_18310 [Lewinellaceae bacterium]|nr:hypothetical protein [Lewinellaceae bacterium]
MSLLTKITILNLLLAFAAFGIGGVRVYHKFRFEVQRETDFTLMESFDQVEQIIRAGVPAADLQNRLMSIARVDTAGPADRKMVFADTLAQHPVLKRPELFRKLTVTREIDGQFYRFMLMNVVIEQSDISRIITNVLQDLFVVLGGILLIFNFLISKWLLGPFKATLEKVKSFNLQSGEVPVFPKTSTVEFKRLNSFLAEMLAKAGKDYRSLKEFSENASHELQTPLAIANGKLELLLEAPGLDDSQLQLVQDAQEALSRLSKLNEALLLLTKIENQEFAPQTPVNFSDILNADVQIFEELAGMKGLLLSTAISPSVLLRIDPSLAHILVGNLLKNAIRHNVGDGWIKVRLDVGQLTVSNTGTAPAVPTDQLFGRFQKSNLPGKSLGLGLAIVKKICDVNAMTVNYTYHDGVHEVAVRF